MDKTMLNTAAVILDGKYYRVEKYPENPFNENGTVFKKAIAYIIDSEYTKGLFPYRGRIDPEEFNPYTAKVGIYSYKKKGKYKIFISRPHNKDEREEYDIDKIKNIMVAVLDQEYAPEQFIDCKLGSSDIGSEIFIPPLYTDDDPLNRLMKTAIREKEAPFDPYGKRLEALAADKRKGGIEGINIRNNAKRAIKTNCAMSPTKFMQYADTWQLESAFIIRDAPGSMHPMFQDDKMLILYPNGIPFEIDKDKLIDIKSRVDEGIMESSKNRNTKDDDD